MKKIFQVELAGNPAATYQYFDEIKTAIESASVNLFAKHRVEVTNISVIDSKVILELDIPDSAIEKGFPVGQHMRGVAAYLMKYSKEKYTKFCVGQRLFNYIEIPMPTKEGKDYISFDSKLSAMAEFVKLLKCDDEKSKMKILKIIEILYGED